MHYCIGLLVAFFAFTTLRAQSLDEDATKRHSFATTYFGAELNYMPHYAPGRYLDTDGNAQSFDRPAFITPSIMIGGTHFWGHADFFISISTSNISLQPQNSTTPSVNNDLGVMTGFKIYPLRLRLKAFRPYVGYKFSAVTYQQSNGHPFPTEVTRVQSMVDIGIGYTSSRIYAYLGYTRIINPNFNVPLSKTHFESVQTAPHFISLGINYRMETTRGASKSPISCWLHEKLLKSNDLGFFVGVGPSAAFPLHHSSYIAEHRPYLDQRAMPHVFPEVAVGYHFSKADVNVALAYRFYRQRRSGFDVSHRLMRHSIVLEAYKFLGDYHGFCPFIGGGISYENIGFKEREAERLVADFTTHTATPVVTFGWDIRPARRGDAWLLRTNLRWMPILQVEHQDSHLSLQHLEFNFIQFVIYPQRIAAQKKERQQNPAAY